MPTDNDVTSNGGIAKTMDKYNYTAGHEVGHVLGLNDAYYFDNPDVNGNMVNESRLIANTETTFGYAIQKVSWHDTIMSCSAQVHNAIPNDIEMILYAYSQGWQSYRGYTDNRYGTDQYSISNKIINQDPEKESNGDEFRHN